jgi:hypothetical protein
MDRVDAGDLQAEAERLRASGALGRPGVLTRLFDYLVQAPNSQEGAPPKEAEIAHAVFGKAAAFDGGQDATVRVYVHRLRKKLEDYYAGPGRAAPLRLTLPKGEYRLVVRPAEAAEIEAAAPAAPPSRRWIVALAVLAALNLAAWAGWWATHRDALSAVRHAVPWAGLGSGDRPLLVVLGDYYIFADIDEATGSGRLVREYGVNSREDLDAWLMDHPEAMGRYRDLDLFYLPAGAAFALRDVLPVLAPKAAQRDDVRVVMASDLTPEMLKRNDVLYVGFLSGLRMLRDPVFAGSRFKVGETYDELIDRKTGRLYESQQGGPDEGQSQQRDYGYFAAFRGPTGNRIVILAGDRDMGLIQAAEAVTSPAALKAIAAQAGHADAFEALFEAQGLRRANLGGRLILAAPLAADRIWAPPKTPPAFPAG